MDFKVVQLDSYQPVVDLYTIVYPGKDTSKFEWLYNQNPCGNADIFAAIENGTGKVIGTYVFIPMKLVVNNKTCLIGQAIDGMVHPDYRGKRVFNVLVSEVFAKITEKYQYLLGFPNNNSRGSLIKAGWIELGEFATYSLPLTTQAITSSPLGAFIKPFLTLYNRFHVSKYNVLTNSLSQNTKEQFSYGSQLHQIQNKNKIIVYRDSDLIKWRLNDVPKDNYTILRFLSNENDSGYICFKSNNNNVEIVDFIIEPTIENQCSALSLFIAYCIKNKYNTIHFQLSEQAYCINALQKLGFMKRKTNHAIIMYDTQESSLNIDYKDCYISLADTDWL